MIVSTFLTHPRSGAATLAARLRAQIDAPRVASSWLPVLAIACLPVMSSIKNDGVDEGAIDASTFLVEAMLDPVSAWLRGHSLLLAIPFALALAIIVLGRKRLVVRSVAALPLMLLLYVFATFRGALADLAFGLAQARGMVAIAAILMLAIALKTRFGTAWYRRRLLMGMALGMAAVVAVNLYVYLAGGGFPPGASRFFGMSRHPNFVGVQMAAALILFVGCGLGGRGRLRLAWWALAAVSAFLLYLTGSRTALIVAGVGILATVIVTRRLTPTAGLMTAILGIGGFVLLGSLASDIDVSAYDRGGTNTRAAAYSEMLDLIADAPFVGQGQFGAVASENSYLRGWVTFGIFYLIGLVAVVYATISRLARAAWASRPTAPEGTLFGLAVGLAVGGMLEGYLLDSFSGQMIAWALTVSACGYYEPRPRDTAG